MCTPARRFTQCGVPYKSRVGAVQEPLPALLFAASCEFTTRFQSHIHAHFTSPFYGHVAHYTSGITPGERTCALGLVRSNRLFSSTLGPHARRFPFSSRLPVKERRVRPGAPSHVAEC